MSTSNMAWVDASSVKLGCIGFHKTKLSFYGSLAACKKVNPKAHLIEIFNDNQSRFLMSKKVRKQLITHIGIETHNTNPNLPYGQYWWIGAELKSGTWYWEHSKKQVTYWSKIGGNSYDNPYYVHPYCALVYISKTTAFWNYEHCNISMQYAICQISVMNK